MHLLAQNIVDPAFTYFGQARFGGGSLYSMNYTSSASIAATTRSTKSIDSFTSVSEIA